ncbi:MAG: single-stranded DNA-binding protein [Anaerolineaceae bacterium]|nr:single-stranded DNA-binding protein [Anaerolineaceae bacterium]
MARCLNKVMIIGYLGRDPEMRFTPTGKSVSSFSVACNRSWKSKDGERHTETDWFNVVAWGDLAEISKQYLSKGSMVYVEGRLQIREWVDSNGNPQKSVEIIARDILMMDSKDKNNQNDTEEFEDFPF